MDYFIYWIYGQNEIKLYILSSKFKIDINTNPKMYKWFQTAVKIKLCIMLKYILSNKSNDNDHIFFDTKLSLFMISLCTQE